MSFGPFIVQVERHRMVLRIVCRLLYTSGGIDSLKNGPITLLASLLAQ